ncbi:MAG: class I SAM-dependent methyltransferase, partial [Aeoliella sp.]
MPPEWPEYEMIDFGEGRKLERFGTEVFDRPAPQAEGACKENSTAWNQASAKYTGEKVASGEWQFTARGVPQEPNAIECPITEGCIFQLTINPTSTGQIGLFPEQYVNWQWIAKQVTKSKEPLRVLNLFGYTGASTLAAAAAGAEVTHVDASKPAVATARENAKLSGMSDASIRWIVEDVVKYCRREVKRGSQYHSI